MGHLSYVEVRMEERVVIFLLIGYILGMLTVMFVLNPKKS
jgi:hypothetical protein